jgi:hypothetical protein
MNFLFSLLKDGHDSTWSSKRVVTFMAFLLCAVAFLADVFWDKTITQALFDGMMYIVVAGLGFTASEKFASKP